jgi:FAD/FMN-containing dehydrogenase
MIHGETVVEQSGLEKLASCLSGRLVLPGHADYDKVRSVWNASINRKPAVIVRCQGVWDVMRSLEYAHQQKLQIAIRGGGHNVAGNAVCDNGLVLDLSPMKGVRVDPAARTSHAQPGLMLREFDRETAAFGLATTGGTVSDTGLAGLTLGGGFGWLMGKYGLTCDNVLSFDVVTGDGRFLKANAQENEDLYWALRGGGGNFGVVTSFQFKLYPLTTVVAGLLLYPLSQVRRVLRFYREQTATAPDELELYAVRMALPDGVPAVVLVVCYCGDAVEAEKVLKPIRTFDSPIADTIAPVPYLTLQSMFDAGSPPGMHQYWKTNLLRELSDESLEIIGESFQKMTSRHSFVFLEHLHGAMSRVGKTETAFYHRDARYNYTIMSTWTNPVEAAKHIQFARDYSHSLDRFSLGGGYLNYLGEDTEGRMVQATFGENYQRMVKVKTKYDPDNFFRLNQNVKPAGAA